MCGAVSVAIYPYYPSLLCVCVCLLHTNCKLRTRSKDTLNRFRSGINLLTSRSLHNVQVDVDVAAIHGGPSRIGLVGQRHHGARSPPHYVSFTTFLSPSLSPSLSFLLSTFAFTRANEAKKKWLRTALCAMCVVRVWVVFLLSVHCGSLFILAPFGSHKSTMQHTPTDRSIILERNTSFFLSPCICRLLLLPIDVYYRTTTNTKRSTHSIFLLSWAHATRNPQTVMCAFVAMVVERVRRMHIRGWTLPLNETN